MGKCMQIYHIWILWVSTKGIPLFFSKLSEKPSHRPLKGGKSQIYPFHPRLLSRHRLWFLKTTTGSTVAKIATTIWLLYLGCIHETSVCVVFLAFATSNGDWGWIVVRFEKKNVRQSKGENICVAKSKHLFDGLDASGPNNVAWKRFQTYMLPNGGWKDGDLSHGRIR